MCVQGRGIFDGPVDDAAIAAIAGWNANTVRIPLNEECWLGLDNIDPAYRGAPYIDAVKDLVARVEARGMTPVLELHWSHGQYTGNSAGCSDVHASCQKPMPGMQYTPAFWASVATTFAADRAVVLDLFNEPYPDRATSNADQAWACWRDGGTCPGIGYQVAGMQDLVDAVRGHGRHERDPGRRPRLLQRPQPVARATGPTTRRAISPPPGTSTTSTPARTSRCWDSTLAPVAAQVPLVAGEIGENTCGHAFVDRVMAWFDARAQSYLGWTWNTWDCSSGPSLISNYDGTPTSYGIGVRDHLRAVNG